MFLGKITKRVMTKGRIILLVLAVAVITELAAQEHTDTLRTKALPEVEVEARRVIRQGTTDSYFPSKAQRERSANAFSLLGNLHLPGIVVDQVERTLNYTRGGGRVALEINGKPSNIDELLSLPVSRLKKVQLVRVPSVKYGTDVAVVINVVAGRGDSGVGLGLNAMNALTTNYNDDALWFRFNTGVHELGVNYNFKLNGIDKAFTRTDEHINNPTGLMVDRKIDGRFSGGNYRDDFLSLYYTLNRTNRRTIDVRTSLDWDRFPQRAIDATVDDGSSYTMRTLNESDERQLGLKVYYEERFSARNVLNVWLAANAFANKYQRGFSSPTANKHYDVDGKKQSARLETEFSHTFSPACKLAVGWQQSLAHTSNTYVSLQNTNFNYDDNSQYAFAQASGSLGKLTYSLGLGYGRDAVWQRGKGFEHYAWRPKFYVQYAFNDIWQIDYNLSSTTSLPSLAQMTAYERQDDDQRTTMGNPSLRPFTTYRHWLSLNANKGIFSFMAFGMYEYNHGSIVDMLAITPMGTVQQSWTNDGQYKHLEIGIYCGLNLLGEHLQVYAEPKYVTFISRATLRHNRSNFCLQLGASGWVKKWGFNGYFRTAMESMEGDMLEHRTGTSDINVNYAFRNVHVKLGWRNLFSCEGPATRKILETTNARYETVQGNLGFANMVYVGLSWSFFKGKQTKRRKESRQVDASFDSGIVK